MTVGQAGVTVVGATALLVLVVAVYSSVTVVGSDERPVLTVFGEYRQVLEPGIAIVPPFVSQVHRFGEERSEITAEALSADGTPTSVRARVTTTVTDPERTFRAISTDEYALEQRGRDLLRDAIDEATDTELSDDRRPLALRLRDDLDRQAREWGLRVESAELVAVEHADQ